MKKQVELQTLEVKEKEENIKKLCDIACGITEHKHFQAKFEERNKDMLIKDKAIETSLSGIVITDMEGKFTYVNDSFVKMFGFQNKQEALNKFPIDLHPESEHPTVINSLKIIKAKGRWRSELIAKKKNGDLFNVQISTNLVKGDTGNSICMMASFEDITERKQLAEKILYQKNLLETILNGIPDILSIQNTDMTIKFYNKAGYEFLNLTSDKIKNKKCYELMSLSKPCPKCATKIALKTKKPARLEKCFSEYDLYFDCYSIPVLDNNDNVVYIVEYLKNITDYKLSEKKIKFQNAELETKNKQLQDANKEKEILLKEIHHRVKNNLQTIQSLLNMQKDYSDNEEVNKILDECINRIRSMANIHQSLYQTKNLAKIDISVYIINLTSHLHFSYAKDECVVRFYYEMDNIFLNIEKAVPLGLLLNEIITNALKHAFKGRTEGKITIAFKKINDKYELRVKDDGICLPQDVKISTDINENFKSYGMSLISIFISQLRAKAEILRENGTEYVLKFSA